MLSELEKLAQDNAEAYDKVWEAFGAVLKEGLYEILSDVASCSALLGSRRRRAEAGVRSRIMPNSIKHNQTAIYYATGTDLGRLEFAPARGLPRARDRGATCLIPSTASGSQPALITKESRLSR